MNRFLILSVLLVGSLVVACPIKAAWGEEEKKEVAGKADVLRHVPKKFATLLSVDAENRRVQLKCEDESDSVFWHVKPDAELKIHGWWGRLEQFKSGDRVWVWFGIDRQKQPINVLMLADEISQQDIHGLPHTLQSYDADTGNVTLLSDTNGERELVVDQSKSDLTELNQKKVYVQSAGKKARILATQRQFETMRKQQQQWLRDNWRADGLPGTVSFLHPLSGEMEVVLDHQGIRWGRYLKNGDAVTLSGKAPISALVKHVAPWRERTVVRLVTDSGVDQLDLSVSQRINVQVPEPPSEIQDSPLPTDIGRLTSKQERIDWFLASVYCPCKIAGDRCTGMFYTLASCNVNACGMPNNVRGKVGEMIEDGLTDEQIWRKLQELNGTDVVKQHLLR